MGLGIRSVLNAWCVGLLIKVSLGKTCLDFSKNGFYGKYLNVPAKEILSNIGMLQCWKICSSIAWCSSVNYQRHYLKCELLNTNITASSSSLISAHGFIYMGKMIEIDEDENSCALTTCGAFDKCVSLKNRNAKCIVSDCGDPPNMEFAYIINAKNTSVGSSITYKCKGNYYVYGTDELTCLATGIWGSRGQGTGCTVSGKCSTDVDCSEVKSSLCSNGLCVCPPSYCFHPSLRICALDCKSLLNSGITADGVYTIKPDGMNSDNAFCDMSGGGWTVFQRRTVGDVSFIKPWNSYLSFFGNVGGDYWLGLSQLHALTEIPSEVYFELLTYEDEPMFVHYQNFSVESSSTNFRMTVSNVGILASSNLTQLHLGGLYYHSGRAFSTYDADNDMWDSGNCAATRSGWWMNSCYTFGMFNNDFNDMRFLQFISSKDYIYTKKTIMKVRRIF